MNWVFLTLGALVLWSISNIIGKVVISHYLKKPISYLILILAILALFCLFLIPFKGLEVPSLRIFGWSFLAGFCYILGVMAYLFALQGEEVSRVIPLWQFQSPMVLLLAFFFLGEQLGPWQYLAFFLLVLGGLLIALKEVKGFFQIRPVLYLMLGSCLAFACYDVLTKYIYQEVAYWDGFVWIRLAAFLTGLGLLCYQPWRRDFILMWKSLKPGVGGLVLGGEILDFLGLILFNLAISLGPITLISSLKGSQPIFALFFVLILSLWFPRLLQEELSRKNVLIKITAIILMGLGIWFLYY